MVYVPASADYRSAVRSAYVWAAVVPFVASCFALPFILAGPIYLAAIPRAGAKIWEVAVSLLATAVGLLGLFGALRCAILSVISLRRWRGYPDRHWWFLRGAYRALLMRECVLLGIVVAATALAINGPDWFVKTGRPLAALVVTVVIVAQLSILMAPGDWLRHATVVPYFPRKVGEIDTFGCGESLARHVAELDEIAVSLGLRPLSAFGWNDDLEKEPLVWHEAALGLKTVCALLEHLEAEEIGTDERTVTIADLKRIAHALTRADSQGIPFSLLLRHWTLTSASEWEARKGTCF